LTKRLIVSHAAHTRLAGLVDLLGSHDVRAPVTVVAPTTSAAANLVRAGLGERWAAMRWQRVSFARWALTLATGVLTRNGRVPTSRLAIRALCARVVDLARDQGVLGPYTDIASSPGLAEGLAATFAELRDNQVAAADVPDTIRAIYELYIKEVEVTELADHATVLEAAAAAEHPSELLLLLDVPLRTRLECELVAAAARAASEVIATALPGDHASVAAYEEILGAAERPETSTTSSLDRVQRWLFVEGGPAGSAGDEVSITSAPGEARECTEIARKIQNAASDGTPFDEIAVLLRQPAKYRAHLVEAFRRADIPAHFAHGVIRPDPSGRAFLALLACAAEDLSVRRFAEYLSLGETPLTTGVGAPPEAMPAVERWVPPDAESVPAFADEVADEEPEHIHPGTLRTPLKWERLLTESAVIAGRERWQRRLERLRTQIQVTRREAVDDGDDDLIASIDRNMAVLDNLKAFALPLIGELDDLPEQADWATWLDALTGLATRTLRTPERVLATLAELGPMGPVGPVTLREVRTLLGERIGAITVRPDADRFGKVFVGPIERARGLSFELVIVPGLAEKMFPQKVVEDPLLPDVLRKKHAPALATNATRAHEERVLLNVAVGAARSRVAFSYPRLDVEQSRPRVPSFYGLEILRAAEGTLPDFEELARRAERAGGAHIGWPAPTDPMAAIDAGEFDLAVLRPVLRGANAEEMKGAARYLLSANAHLERALRFRARRCHPKWLPADGLVQPHDDARAAIAAHSLDVRSFSPTALQKYAECPYAFFLYALLRLRPREVPEAIEALDPLQRGSMIHEIHWGLMTGLRARDLLPVTPDNLSQAMAELDDIFATVTKRYQSDLAPVVPRVWEDGLSIIRADINEWLHDMAEDPGWLPVHFELAFGLGRDRLRDEASIDDAVKLDCGIALRGSIDLVERHSTAVLRATDYKTGKKWTDEGLVIGGGEVLQPVLYALVLEKMFKERVASGRLHYCTRRGDFGDVAVDLDDSARAAAELVAKNVRAAIDEGFLPAAPRRRRGFLACDWCDYIAICGQHEERRVRHKPKAELEPLVALREQP